MLHDLGWSKQVKLENSAGTVINPATIEKLDELKAALQAIYGAVDGLELITGNISIDAAQINLNTDDLEAKIQSVRDQLDVLLSTRASETTLTNVKTVLDNIKTVLDTLGSAIDVNLSTLASESTLSSANTKIGEVSATPTSNTLLGRLKDLYDKLTAGIAVTLDKIKIWDGINEVTVHNKTTAAKGLNTLNLGKSSGAYYPEGQFDELEKDVTAPFYSNYDGLQETRSAVLTDELSFVEQFKGDTLSDNWESTIGDGASITVGDSKLVIEAGIAADAEIYIVREIDYIPLRCTFALDSISQRIDNQEIFLELSDSPIPDDDTSFVRIRFSGIDSTKCYIESKSSNDATATEGTTELISINDTGSYNYLSISITTEGAIIVGGYTLLNETFKAVRAKHFPDPYQVLYVRIRIKNGTIAPASNTTLKMEYVRCNNINRLDVKNDFLGSPLLSQLIGTNGNSLIPVKVDDLGRLQVVITPSAANKTLQILWDRYHQAVNNGEWQELLTYTVPAGYNLNCISFDAVSPSVANEAARVMNKECFGSFKGSTNTFTDGTFNVLPRFSTRMYIYVTTQIGSAINNAITITYTNAAGVTGRTGTITLTKNLAVGTRLEVLLQTGDRGIIDVTNVTHSATGQVGDFNVEGVQELFYLTLTSANNQYAANAVGLGGIVVPSGDCITLQYLSSSGTNYRRRLNLIATLVPIT